MPESQEIILYRMVLPDHTCPFGVRAKAMLEQAAVAFEDRILGSRDEVESFKAEHGVDTTPQLFVDGERLGGSGAIERFLADQAATA